MFSELPGLINVNAELRKQLDCRLEGNQWNPVDGCLGDIFLNLAPYLKMYSSYVKNFNNALSIVSDNITRNAPFAQFVAKQNADPNLKGLPLEAYLILPVQRIPRYKMLLEDLLKNTGTDHPDRITLEKSLARIAEVAVFVNESIREHEMIQELIEVQKSLHGLDEV
ncbi:FYVE, RhoGEF and PH domain-containing protein 6 [Thoreauomyces humboldtii]|nr:FYVE, RhoGEF and PH domain-containing protein 6 [Thoreauomyces humboldtii]